MISLMRVFGSEMKIPKTITVLSHLSSDDYWILEKWQYALLPIFIFIAHKPRRVAGIIYMALSQDLEAWYD
jgi:hypothetical protein